MKRKVMGIAIGLMVVVTASIVGCESAADKAPMMKAPFGGPDDMARAKRLWRTMSRYKTWPTYPGLGGWQDGRSPHGKVLRYYINTTAARNPENPGNGSIIIKENYMKKSPDALGAITVMQKIPGYDPENKDWFWVKFAPDGSVMKNPKNMSLAGRVAKGMPKGCIACHSNAGGDDMLFINDE